MKAYTDIGQSRKLAEILPLESADMHYNNVSIKGINYVDEHRAELMEYNRAIKVLSKYTINPLFEIIPCWSLAALLEILPNNKKESTTLSRGGWIIGLTEFKYTNDWWCEYKNDDNHTKDFVVSADNPIDSCYNMIIKLKEQNLL